MVRFFNLYNDGELLINKDGTKRKAKYTVERFNAPIENLYRPMQFMVQLYCNEPYLLGLNEQSHEMVTWEGGLSFPLRLPATFSMAGEKIFNMVNSGDVAVPVEIVITGKATNPAVTNLKTGEFIKVNRAIEGNDEMVITTAFGNKRVTKNGVNVFNYIDLGSTFFSLGVGDNVLELTTDDLDDSANITISYVNQYVGV